MELGSSLTFRVTLLIGITKALIFKFEFAVGEFFIKPELRKAKLLTVDFTLEMLRQLFPHYLVINSK